MSDALQISSTAMVAATRRLDAVARDVAGLGTATVETGTGQSTLPPAARVDLSATALDLVGAKTAFAMNAAVHRTADTMQRRLLDVTA